MKDENLMKIMGIEPHNIASSQLNALEQHAVSILKTVIRNLSTGNYDSIEAMTSHSPAGDGYGLDNNYIDFGYDGENSIDIYELCQKLKSLKSQVNRVIK